jgi:hypothetical protein
MGWMFGFSSIVLRGRLVLVALVAGLVLGCTYPAYRPDSPSVESEAVRVEFLEQDDDIFKFMVYSRAHEPMLILRDQVFLLVGGDRIARVPGGLKSTYDLPPGGAHDVFVAYDLSHLEGVAEFSISFETAVTLNGAPVRGPVLGFSRASN